MQHVYLADLARVCLLVRGLTAIKRVSKYRTSQHNFFSHLASGWLVVMVQIEASGTTCSIVSDRFSFQMFLTTPGLLTADAPD